MKRIVTHISPAARVAIVLAACIVISLIIGMGCTDRLKGDVTANQKPYVNFVNVPPDLQRFSRNPVINWYGSDVDGIIASFRYVVVLKVDVGIADPIAYVLNTGNVPASAWTQLIVDPAGPDPQTSQIVHMSADLTDPIRQYVEQYVFLQAFDAEGAASDVVYRLFSRNDHPPQTTAFGYAPSDTPFVNSVFPGGAISGVPVRWLGFDVIDYPQDPPPFLFHWRLYGPYTELEFTQVKTFFTKVFLTRESQMFRLGDTLRRCDTTIIGVDTTVTCQSVVVADLPANRALIATIFGADYGVFEPYFDTAATGFIDTAAKLNRIVAESQGVDTFWTSETSDTIFNVFKNNVSDTTQELRFVLWVRSKDDAGVVDPVPAYLANGIPVVDPKFERHVLILDYTNPTGAGALNIVIADSARVFWQKYLNEWEASASLDSQWAYAVDRIRVSDPPPKGLFKRILQHRVIILYNDHAIKANFWESPSAYGPVLKAVSGGVNCWWQMRCPILGTFGSTPQFNPVPPFSFLYTLFFGVVSPAPNDHYYHSGWAYHANGAGIGDTTRNESFKGARPITGMELMWPPLLIDTSLLHKNYNWSFRQDVDTPNVGDTTRAPFRWVSELSSLPEVNYTPRLTPGTDPMYFFYSLYSNIALGDSTNGQILGGSHPLGPRYDHSFYPIAHQFNSGFFRTVHMDFTLPAIKRDGNLSTVFNRIMDYLWDSNLNAVVSEKRYPDARAAWTRDEFRSTWNRVRDQWNLEAGWVPEDALK